MHKTLLFWIYISFIPLLSAQSIQNQVIVSAGGSNVAINSLDWTLGEPLMEYFKNKILKEAPDFRYFLFLF
ncbi:MAG: hypothetical protein IPL55_12375 [Saprospiraceae bacterium]|jgi:hypothetical protein|nr:hypothetical protein [Saprospiraceae bacterium]